MTETAGPTAVGGLTEVAEQPTNTPRNLTITPAEATQELPSATPSATPSLPPPAANPPRPAATAPSRPAATTIPTPAGELIRSFTASPTLINPGDNVTLTWETGGEMAMLCPVRSTGQLDACWEVPTTGWQTVKSPDSVRNVLIYQLFARKGDYHEIATVTVAVTCPDVWFFPNPPAACPYAVERSYGVYERFERGLMIWREATDLIYIFYLDANWPKWDVVLDRWKEGIPESDPKIVPPPGLYQPVRGFGLLWRGEAGYEFTNIRDRLGWAIEPEVGYDADYQCDSAPKYNTCYLRGPNDQIIVLQPERSGWYIWTGPRPTPTP